MNLLPESDEFGNLFLSSLAHEVMCGKRAPLEPYGWAENEQQINELRINSYCLQLFFFVSNCWINFESLLFHGLLIRFDPIRLDSIRLAVNGKWMSIVWFESEINWIAPLNFDSFGFTRRGRGVLWNRLPEGNCHTFSSLTVKRVESFQKLASS